ncbi:acyl transferase domain-containing protein [Brevibacterium sanguinis]|uniref:Acyl transferase domain-containing protein n=2 Tax=Brevibacterium TaxID=1696 RepID=A0A366IHB6_9MICO|nr:MULTISPECIES: type I polyketide synthase [Brevibacterium]RBP64943.1 acyl transferase domain-containing protein [Brevibacterium sanguinis]RBP71206.1 acyl transferase domain-containing protein [Brevibacterium celere]
MNDTPDEHIAVVGMSCRFPGAPSIADYWDLISSGRTGLTELTEDELRAAGVPRAVIAHPDHVPVAGLLEDPTTFDAAGIGLSETEAGLMDPQQRLALECSVEALEAAGLGRPGHRGAVGVYAGQAFSAHLVDNLGDRFHPRGGADPIDSLHLHGLNIADYLPARIAWQLGLDGPTVDVGATCATSLVAIHLAVEALLGHQCDTALAGGVSLRLPQEQGYLSVPDGPFSRDGRTCSYGEGATGTVFTQGAGMVALRRLGDALADGDPIHAVVLGTAIGNDGPDRVGFTAPSVSGQARVIAEALAAADVDPRDVGLIEGHGTGTMLGDPIEVRALVEVFGAAEEPWCALGSVKSMIGHADSAAGVAGFIKAVLAVEHGLIPPTLDADTPNPALPLAGSPFTLATTARTWEDPRRVAGVSAFGIGGINAHAIIASAPDRSRGGGHPGRGEAEAPLPSPLLISAADPEALEHRTEQVRDLAATAAPQDLAGTLAHGSRHLGHRRALLDEEATPVIAAGDTPPRLVAVMPGGGAQHAGMAAGFHAALPTFARSLDASSEAIVELGGRDPRDFVLDPGAAGGEDTRIGLPALAAVELAYLDLLADYGLRPDVALGHSLGEYSAAVVAGAMDRRDALHLVVERARLFATLPSGAMLSLPVSAQEAEEILFEHPEVDLAAVNGPLLSVVAGSEHAITALEDSLDRREIDHRRLRVAVASHSRLVEPVLSEIMALSAGFPRPAPSGGLITGIDGSEITAPLSADHWARHLRAPVRFDLALDTALRGGDRALVLQTGPGGDLAAGAASAAVHVHSCWTTPAEAGSASRAAVAFARTLAIAWSHGLDVDLDRLAPRGRTVPLPPYPWQRRQRGIPHRLGYRDTLASSSAPRGDGPVPSEAEPLQLPRWRQEPRHRVADAATAVVVALSGNVAEELRAALIARGVVLSEAAAAAPGASAGPEVLVHLSSPANEEELRAEAETFGRLARSIGEIGVRGLVHLTLGAEDVLGTETVNPFATATSGLVRVLGQEVEGIAWTTVDLDLAAPAWDRAVEEILRFHTELTERESAETTISALQPHRAVRGSRSWTRRWDSWHPASGIGAMDHDPGEPEVWVVTGGLGSVGLALAERIEANSRAARIVLAGRSLPEAGSERARRLAGLERTRAARVDVAAPGALAALLDSVVAEHGRLDHIVHAPVHVDLAPLAELDTTSIEAAFAPKIRGTLELSAALESLPAAPSVLLLSSVAGTIGGFGLGAYVAAGRFLDGFATAKGWTTLDLDRIRTGSSEESNSAAEISMRYAIDLDDAVTTILRVIGLDVKGMIAASPAELDSRTAHLDSTRTTTANTSPDGGSELTGWEGIVAEVWSRVLSRPVTSPADDFFALGGHSLLATRVLATFRSEHGIDLRLRELLSAPTVADCARLFESRGHTAAATGRADEAGPHDKDAAAGAVTAATAEPTEAGELAGAARHEDSRFGLTRVQHAYWIGRTRGLDPASPEGHGVGCHFYLEYAVTDLDVARYRQAWRDVVARHPMLRAIITAEGEHRILELPPDWAPQLVDLRGEDHADEALADLREQWSTRVADPSRWPLVTPVIVGLPDGTWRVLLSVDVLVCDSASWMIVDREVRARYLDPSADLGEEPPSFARCLRALEGRDEDSRREEAWAHWRERLDRLPDAPRIARAGSSAGDEAAGGDGNEAPRRLTSRPHFTRLAGRIPAETWARWTRDCALHRVTPTAFVLSRYRSLLARWSGDERFSITLSVFDRPDLPGVDRVVGEFSSMIIHEADESGAAGPQLWENVRATHDRLVEDLDQSGVSGIDVLAEWSRRRGRTGNIPVVFTSMLGLDSLGGAAHDHEWLGTQVHGVSQTPQVWLDHQAFDHRGDLVLQWDVCDTVVDLAEAREWFSAYLASFEPAEEDPSSAPRSADLAPTSAQDDGTLREAVTMVWAELLGLDPEEIGAETFLTLGGDSLLAVRMASALRRATGTGLPLNEIRADITVADLVALLSDRDPGVTRLPLRRRADPCAPFPLLPLQQGYFVGQSGGWDNSYRTAHVSTDVALTLPAGEPDPEALEALLRRAVDAVAAHQPMVRAEVLPDGTQRLRDPEDESARTPATVIDLRDHPDPETELARLRAVWATEGPDPESGPAVAVDVVLLGRGRGRLHVSSSLLVMDGWSAALYDRELFAQLAEPGTLEAPLEIDFGDYVDSVTSPSVESAREEHRRWWFERLESLPAPPRLPHREPDGEHVVERMTMREFWLEPDDWRVLRDVCRSHGVTPATAVLSVFALALQRLTGRSEILLNSMQHNRVPIHADIDRLIGAFSRTALLPLRLPGGTVLETMRSIAGQVDEHGRRDLVTAVEVGRELGRRRGRSTTIAPVVFQSTLGMDSALGGSLPERLGPLGRIHLGDFHQDIRTPQVELELRVFELEGSFIASLASVDEVLAEGVPDRVLEEVATGIEALHDPETWTTALPPVGTGVWELECRPGAERTETARAADRVGPVGNALAVDEGELAAVARLWAEMLELPQAPSRDEDFFSLGGDSLLAVRMLTRHREETGRRIEIRDFLSDPTPSGLVRTGQPEETRRPVPEESLFELRAGTGRPIFLLHPSGGDVLCYVELARRLDTARPVVAIGDPGLDDHPVPGTVEGMVGLYRDLIRTRQPIGPLTIGGWSMGGTLAQELARRLRSDGCEVDALLMIDSNSPERIVRLTGMTETDAEDVQRLRQLRSIEAFLGLDLGRHEHWRGLAEQLDAHGALPAGEHRERRFEVFRRHMDALARHRAGVLDEAVPTLLVRAAERSPRNSAEGMGVDDTAEADLGWSPWITGPLRVVDVDAHHYSVIRSPAVEEVADEISAFLAKPADIHGPTAPATATIGTENP